MFRKRDDQPPEADESVRDEHAYEGNWYRSLKALADQHAQEELAEGEGAIAEELDETAEEPEEIVLQEDVPVVSQYDEPGYEEPAQEPTFEEPAAVVSEYDEPGYEEPAAYEEPATEEPTFEEPAAVVSEYDEPGYEAPAAYEEEPAQEEPFPVVSRYDEPGYGEPAAYEEPAGGEADLGAPAISTPVSDELHTRAGALLERLRRLQHLGDEQEDTEARSSA